MKECDNGMESDKSEYIGGAEAYRPQTPTDAKVPQGSWTPGKPPVGGFRSVFAFGNQGKTTTGTTPFKAPYFKDKKEGTY
jgi:hypothetical protein